MKLARVVSGGQTGADRAALDAARAGGLRYGGWCPAGGWAEDLQRPPGLMSHYPSLRETPTGEVALRTEWNVRDSDATLVLHLRDPVDSPGTGLTIAAATRLGRPYLLARADDPERVSAWLRALPDELVLNVAGPRESEEPGLYAAARLTLSRVFGGG